MLQLAIVEDDQNYRNEYKAYLQQMAKDFGVVFRVREFSDGDGILQNYQGQFDIILMDIEMAFVDGMSAAREIRQADKDVVIIFVTNMPQYAIKGYTVGALDYILKPVSYFAFSQSVLRAVHRLESRRKRSLVVSVHGGVQRISVADIRYIEVIDHDLIYHTVEGDVTTRGAMRDILDKLQGADFFQCNKGILINLAYVDAVQNSDVRLGKTLVQVSRARKKALLEALNDYFAEKGA